MLRFGGASGFTKTQRKPRWQLFGLGEVRLRTSGKRSAHQRCDALIGLHAFTLINHHSEISFANLIKGRAVSQTIRIIGSIGPNAGRLTILIRAIIICCDHPHGTLGLHLQLKLPTQLDRLTNQRGQQRHLGHQRLNLRRVIVLAQNALKHPIQPRNPPANVCAIKLKRQNAIVPRDLSAVCHWGFLIVGRLAYRVYIGAATFGKRGRADDQTGRASATCRQDISDARRSLCDPAAKGPFSDGRAD